MLLLLVPRSSPLARRFNVLPNMISPLPVASHTLQPSPVLPWFYLCCSVPYRPLVCAPFCTSVAFSSVGGYSEQQGKQKALRARGLFSCSRGFVFELELRSVSRVPVRQKQLP